MKPRPGTFGNVNKRENIRRELLKRVNRGSKIDPGFMKMITVGMSSSQRKFLEKI